MARIGKMKQILWDEELPPCDFCGEGAEFDSPTEHGPWANMCFRHLMVNAKLSSSAGFQRVPI